MKNKASKKVFSSVTSQVLFYVVCFLLLAVIPMVMIMTFKHIAINRMPVLNGSHFFSWTPNSAVYKWLTFYLMMISLIFIAPGLVVFGGRDIEAYEVMDSGIKHRRLIRAASVVLLIIMVGFFVHSYMHDSQVEADYDSVPVEEIQSEYDNSPVDDIQSKSIKNFDNKIDGLISSSYNGCITKLAR